MKNISYKNAKKLYSKRVPPNDQVISKRTYKHFNDIVQAAHTVAGAKKARAFINACCKEGHFFGGYAISSSIVFISHPYMSHSDWTDMDRSVCAHMCKARKTKNKAWHR